MSDKEMFYFSSVKGIDQKETGGSYVYYGLTFRVPKADVHNESKLFRHFDNQSKSIREMIDNVEQRGDYFPFSGMMERYEVIDAATGDILVMVRVPFQVKTVLQ